jgi:hypothetical protein
VPGYVSLKLVVQSFADRSHRRENEQLAVGKRRIARPYRQDKAAEAKSSAIELAQRERIGDCRAALKRRCALRIARSQNAAQQNEDADKKSQPRGPFPTNATHRKRLFEAPRGQRLLIQEISRKADGLSRGNPDRTRSPLHVAVKQASMIRNKKVLNARRSSLYW